MHFILKIKFTIFCVYYFVIESTSMKVTVQKFVIGDNININENYRIIFNL